jgi:hypothetical protein
MKCRTAAIRSRPPSRIERRIAADRHSLMDVQEPSTRPARDRFDEHGSPISFIVDLRLFRHFLEDTIVEKSAVLPRVRGTLSSPQSPVQLARKA